MSKTNKQLSGAAAQQKINGQINEVNVLFALAKFGWLTSHQIGKWIWAGDVVDDNRRANKILTRLHQQKYVTFEVLQKSPGAQIRGWFLKPKGMTRLKDYVDFDVLKIKSTKRSITDSHYQYHRLLSNQALIDMYHNNNLGIYIDEYIKHVFCENEMRPVRKTINSHFGCIPDGLFLYENSLVCVEVENSCRGPGRHGSKIQGSGNKLHHWLEPFTIRKLREGFYNGTFGFIDDLYTYDDAFQLFVCSTEKIFRNIHRKMNALLPSHEDGYGVFFYVVLKKRLWVDPFRESNIVLFDHDDEEALELIEIGEKRKRKYPKRKK